MAEKKVKHHDLYDKDGCKKVCSIGGQAVIEGVMMRGDSAMAIAVRDGERVMRIEAKRVSDLKGKGFFFNFPVVRGAVRFFLNLIDGMKVLMRSAEVFGEGEPSKAEKAIGEKLHVRAIDVAMGIAVILGIALAIGLFILLPNFLATLIPKPPIWTEDGWFQVYLAVFKLAILIGYLMLMLFIPDVKRTFMYHGAEHKTINCYENGLPLTVENVQSMSTFNNRCGTTFLFFTLAVSIIVSLFLGNHGLFLNVLFRILVLPVTAGLSYELLKAVARAKSPLLAPLKFPGYLMQKITTAQPDDSMCECAIAAFNAVQELMADPEAPERDFELPKKLVEVRVAATEELGSANAADVDWMLCAVMKCRRSELNALTYISVLQYENFSKMMDQRRTGMPLSQILGFTSFYGYDVAVTSDVLCPRFETELVCEQAIIATKALQKTGATADVLDLCTGSGAMAVAIKKETGANVTASDVSARALELATANAENNEAEIEFLEGDLFTVLEGRRFDVIVSNPPYIRTADVAELDTEVKDFEPMLALDGGADGLDFYRRIAKEAAAHLKEGGTLALEIGDGQDKDVCALLSAEGFVAKTKKDYSGIERIVIASLPTKKN